MSKTPPNRRGITFEVGAALEARDNLKNWYAANIEKIDYEDEKVLIHYRQWSHRYDEWFDWASPYLRPVERVQLRRERLQEDSFIPGFNVNDKVLASWSDCRFYPAKVLAVNKDASYTVKFYDGVIQTVKGLHVKPFIKEKRKKLADRNDEKHQVKKAEKDKKKPENGASRGKQTSLSPAEQADRGSVEEEDDISDWDGDGEEQKNSGISDRNTGHKNSQLHEVEYLSVKKENEEVERVLEEIGQHNYSKSFLMKDSGHEEREQEATVKMEVDSVVLHSCMNFSEGNIRGSETEDAEVQAELEKEDIKNLPHNRKSQRKRMRGKRRISMSKRRCPLKKSKTVSNSDGFHSDSEAAPALTNQRTQKIGLEPAASLLTLPSNGTTMLKAQSQSETPKPTAVRKQSFHNPNRFSREPLYRVIKNQPPPVLSINLDHNPFKCSAPGCTKSFRKAKLLHYHMKYYHGVDCPIEEDLCPSKDNQNRAVDKQAPLINQDGAKRRCTTSVSMYSTSANIIEKRRSSAPPVVSVQNYQQWPSLKEKTKENQLCSNTLKGSNKEKERRANVKEHDRLKEKQSKDFLHIQLSKNKKKKSMSDEDSISDWSSDSCGWSEDDMEMDLDIITSPLSSSSVASTTGSREIVRCVCEVEEENDFMLQCEACRYWQHGTCMGLLEENVPERYACFICRDSPVLIRGQRQSLRDWYDTDWFSSGHMYGLSFLENYSHQNAKKIAATHQLLGDVQRVVEVLSGLQLKISVLQSQAHPDLKLWCQPWKLPETFSMKSTALQDSEASLQKEPLSSSFQDYISSEHCYQKPHALHPRLEPRLMVKTRVESGLEDRVRTETLLKNKQHCSGEIQSALSKTLRSQFSDHSKGVGEELGVDADGGGVKETQNQQWRINLLEHIESVQEEVTHRMDFIERELDVLENWLDCTGELEPPEPLDRLPELKHNIKQLLNELDKVQQIALVCAT